MKNEKIGITRPGRVESLTQPFTRDSRFLSDFHIARNHRQRPNDSASGELPPPSSLSPPRHSRNGGFTSIWIVFLRGLTLSPFVFFLRLSTLMFIFPSEINDTWNSFYFNTQFHKVKINWRKLWFWDLSFLGLYIEAFLFVRYLISFKLAHDYFLILIRHLYVVSYIVKKKKKDGAFDPVKFWGNVWMEEGIGKGE